MSHCWPISGFVKTHTAHVHTINPAYFPFSFIFSLFHFIPLLWYFLFFFFYPSSRLTFLFSTLVPFFLISFFHFSSFLTSSFSLPYFIVFLLQIILLSFFLHKTRFISGMKGNQHTESVQPVREGRMTERSKHILYVLNKTLKKQNEKDKKKRTRKTCGKQWTRYRDAALEACKSCGSRRGHTDVHTTHLRKALPRPRHHLGKDGVKNKTLTTVTHRSRTANSCVFCVCGSNHGSEPDHRVHSEACQLTGNVKNYSLLSTEPFGGTCGSCRPLRADAGVPEGLVWTDPARGFALKHKREF